ncbi:MAG: nickel pincer cofactor biosynthesis protein LarB, partial [Planctomycetes bacterium]|nr:nickel pincer cofactor biosynthesis protein LarB [Planctomycetota bacterium]
MREVLQQLQRGERSVDEALQLLTAPPRATDLGFATVDHDRAARCGFPEVVFCQGKTPADAAHIAAEILTRADRVLLTRATAEHAAAVAAVLPRASYHQRARCITVAPAEVEEHGLVAVVCAGTADLPVAEEAAVTARAMGARVEELRDVGVAGLHRILSRVDRLRAANAVVVVAGMEGALPSVVGGLVDRPVIAVPTSVGYGASFGGVA